MARTRLELPGWSQAESFLTWLLDPSTLKSRMDELRQLQNDLNAKLEGIDELDSARAIRSQAEALLVEAKRDRQTAKDILTEATDRKVSIIADGAEAVKQLHHKAEQALLDAERIKGEAETMARDAATELATAKGLQRAATEQMQRAGQSMAAAEAIRTDYERLTADLKRVMA